MRMCVGCREMKEKKSLIRVVRSPEGELSLDPTGKKPGRGAYVCREGECLARAIKQHQLERQLQAEMTEEVSEGLRRELEALRVIECLKRSGMEIKDIKQFMLWCARGSETYPERRELFLRQKETVESEIHKLEKVLDMLRFKCWYYEQAIEDGNEDRLMAMLPDKLPEDIQAMYDRAHGDQ